MRTVALSDIHGNLAALDAVLEDIQTQGIDLIVNLGDITSGLLQPRETVDQLMMLNLSTTRDSHEGQILADDLSRMGVSDQYALEQLRPDQLTWPVGLPVLRYIDDDILSVHGSAQDNQTYLLESLSENGCRMVTHDEVLHHAEDAGVKLVLCGYTHIPRAMKLASGRFIVNPGSVGLQAYSDTYPSARTTEIGSPHVRYAVVTEHADEWTAEFRAVEYMWNDAAAIAEQRDRQDWAVTLYTGRVQV